MGDSTSGHLRIINSESDEHDQQLCLGQLGQASGLQNVYELWNDVYGSALSDNPMSTDQIVDLVQRTGWSFRWENYRIHPHLSVNECLPGAEEVGDQYGCSTAVCYVRPDGTGHCVVRDVYNACIPLCYQQDDDGEDVEEDIKANAEVVSLLRLKCPPRTTMHQAWLNRIVRRMMEKRAAERSWTWEYRTYMDIHKSRRTGTFDEFHKTLADLCTRDEPQTGYEGGPGSSSWSGNSQMCQFSEQEDKQRYNRTIRAKL
jgi:hypothetical protein